MVTLVALLLVGLFGVPSAITDRLADLIPVWLSAMCAAWSHGRQLFGIGAHGALASRARHVDGPSLAGIGIGNFTAVYPRYSLRPGTSPWVMHTTTISTSVQRRPGGSPGIPLGLVCSSGSRVEACGACRDWRGGLALGILALWCTSVCTTSSTTSLCRDLPPGGNPAWPSYVLAERSGGELRHLGPGLRPSPTINRCPIGSRDGLWWGVWRKARDNPKELERFAKFAIVGAIGAVVDFSMFNLMKWVFESVGLVWAGT